MILSHFIGSHNSKITKSVEGLAFVDLPVALQGRNVVLESKFGSPRIVNDGVTVAKEVDMEDEVENIGAKLVRQVGTFVLRASRDWRWALSSWLPLSGRTPAWRRLMNKCKGKGAWLRAAWPWWRDCRSRTIGCGESREARKSCEGVCVEDGLQLHSSARTRPGGEGLSRLGSWICLKEN